MKFIKVLIVFVWIFASCKSTKVVNNPNLKGITVKKVAKKHLQSYCNKQTIDAKLKVNYKNAKDDLNFSVQMKIKKDEVIYLKGTKFITVFKAKITPNKIQYYSPFFKDYFEGDFSVISKLLGTQINFKQLQNLLLGQSVLDISSKKQVIEFAKQSYKLSPKHQSDWLAIFLFINPEHFRLNKQIIVDKAKSRRLEVRYPDYLKENNELFPKRIKINAQKDRTGTLIDITVRSVVFNTNLRMPFSIPSGYKLIQL